MRTGAVIAILFLLGIAHPAAAEFYRYKDAHGNTIYTDDYSKVPPEQRDNTQSYDEYISGPGKDSDEPQPQEPPSQPQTKVQNDQDSEDQRLKAQEKALAEEFEGLTAERNMLDEEKKKAVTKLQIRDYNNKVVKFNARIKAFEEKRNAHTAEVKKYNARIKEQESGKQSQ